MKIPIETKEEKDQPEEKEAWMEELHHNAAIMSACMNTFPDKPECVWVALFKSIVPSASPGDIGKLLKVGFDLLGKTDKSMDGLIILDHDAPPEPPPVAPEVFEGGGPAIIDEPPEPPPEIPKPQSPVVAPASITVGTTATLLYENQSGKSKRISVSNDSVVQDMWIGTQNGNRHLGNMIPKKECRDVVVPAGRSLWGITGAGTVRARIDRGHIARLLKDLFESTSDDMPVCCLCGSRDLLQTVYLHGKVTEHSGDSYIIPSTGETVSLSESFVCMRCLRKLIERERKCQTRV